MHILEKFHPPQNSEFYDLTVFYDFTAVFYDFPNLRRLEPLHLMSPVRNRYGTRSRSQQSHDRNRTVRYFWG